MGDDQRSLLRVFMGDHAHATAQPQFPIAVAGVITRADNTGAWCTLITQGFTEHQEFGPMHWNRALVDPISGVYAHGHDPTMPQPGQECLVIFVPPESSGWIVAWW